MRRSNETTRPSSGLGYNTLCCPLWPGLSDAKEKKIIDQQNLRTVKREETNHALDVGAGWRSQPSCDPSCFSCKFVCFFKSLFITPFIRPEIWFASERSSGLREFLLGDLFFVFVLNICFIENVQRTWACVYLNTAWNSSPSGFGSRFRLREAEFLRSHALHFKDMVRHIYAHYCPINNWYQILQEVDAIIIGSMHDYRLFCLA